jgi:polysaccharide chain length determinant protein (PEP-CTERM system associated)
MLPGKTYTPEDFLWMAWKRKWLILLPTVLIALATFTVAQLLPNRYRSQTTILVIPQRVPEKFVASTVTADVGERLQTISQQILSRTRLERIVEEFNLYQKERQTMIMEDIIEQMRRRDVGVASDRGRADGGSFTVSFEADNPRTAMLVAERLASMFVQENLQDREVMADSTSQFLQAQLEDARRRLIEHEKKLEDFRRRNAGQLPTQVTSNLQMMQTTQMQIQANADGAGKDRDRLRVLEEAIADAESAERDTPPEPVVTATGDTPGGTAAQQLESARATLRSLELRLKPEHPDVIRARRVIKELEAKAEREALASSVSADGTGLPQTPQQQQAAARLAAMKLEAQEINQRLQTRKQDEEKLQKLMAAYNTRLEAGPGLESEFTELTRDYSTLQEQYTTLLRKSEESKIAVNLERRQIGEQFKVIDGARLPERPISPNRIQINLMGLLAGLGVGVALAGLLEYRDTTLKTDDDVTVSLTLPVLAVIPAMTNLTERIRMKRRRRLVAAASASLASLVIMAGVVIWRMELLRAWVR